jgi:hypothetical protein
VSDLERLMFGPGYCSHCGLLKPLAMVAVPGMRENERGELEGGTFFLDPHDEQRRGYCHECAVIVLNKKPPA